MKIFSKSRAAHRSATPIGASLAKAGQVAVVATIGLALAFNANAASAAGLSGLTSSSSVTTVASAGKVVLTATQPVVSADGTQSQVIVQKIDKTKTRLTSIDDIVFPHGWTLFVSYDNGASFTDVLPTSATGSATSWDLVDAVKAAGDIYSNGEVSGRQAVTGSGTLVTPESGQFTGGGTGDGWNVIFDDANHVFRMSHHSDVTVSCYTRLGADCGPGWEFAPGGNFTTAMSSPGLVDNVHHHLWLAVALTTNSTTGFLCVDISDFTAGPSLCGGTSQTAYQALGGMARSYGTVGMTSVGNKFYEWSSAGQILCLDTSANGGAGAPCANQPYTDANITYAGWSYNTPGQVWTGSMIASKGKIYGTAADGQPLGGPNGGNNSTMPDIRAMCIDPATDARCAGWETAKVLPAGENFDYSYELPNANGDILGVCFQKFSTAGGEDATCFKEDGTTLAQNATLAHAFKAFVGNGAYTSNTPTVFGTHVYWSGGDGVATPVSLNEINCFDTSTNLPCAGGWPIVGTTAYTAVLDPQNSNCLWTNDNYNNIKAFNVLDTTATVCGPPPGATFAPEAIVPRMGCSGEDAMDAWGNFTITSPAPDGYDSAKLTVYDSNGVKISGFTSMTPTSYDTNSNPVFDLSSLPIADSGQHPAFYIELLGRSSSDSIMGSLQAVGQSPQLCTTLTSSETSCQNWLGPLVDPVWSYAPEATGSVQAGSGAVNDFEPATSTLSAAALEKPVCGGQLYGTATEGTKAVFDAEVTLLDEAGTPVLLDGKPVIAYTDATGYYTFGYLAAGNYRVSFAKAGKADAILASFVTGADGSISGDVEGLEGVATSNTVAIAPAVSGSVNAEYYTAALDPTDDGSDGVLALTGAIFSPPLMLSSLLALLLSLAGFALWRVRLLKARKN